MRAGFSSWQSAETNKLSEVSADTKMAESLYCILQLLAPHQSTPKKLMNGNYRQRLSAHITCNCPKACGRISTWKTTDGQPAPLMTGTQEKSNIRSRLKAERQSRPQPLSMVLATPRFSTTSRGPSTSTTIMEGWSWRPWYRMLPSCSSCLKPG